MAARSPDRDFIARLSHRAFVLGASLVVACTGCATKHTVTSPTVPPPTLEEIWPSPDGNSWVFQGIARKWDEPTPVYYANPASVPPVTFDTIATVFASRFSGANVVADTGVIELRFNGTALVGQGIYAPGITAQVLELNQLAPLTPIHPQFLRAGLWRRTSQWIGAYETNVASDTFPDWKYFDGVTTPGRTFQLQLLPQLAPDVVLHGKVVRTIAVPTGAGIEHWVEVQYYVDYGTSEATDDQGNLLGSFRQFSCASVIYAPGVGPVTADERYILYAGGSLRTGRGDLRLMPAAIRLSHIAARLR
jgi:hypothetical protein